MIYCCVNNMRVRITYTTANSVHQGTSTAGFMLDRPGVPSRTIFTKHTKF